MAPSVGQTRSAQLRGHQGPVHALEYSSGNAQYLLSASGDRTIHLWNPSRAATPPSTHDRNPALIQAYGGGHNQDVFDVSVSTDNATFVSGGGDKSVVQWDTATANVTRRYGGLYGHTGAINSVMFAGESDSVIVSGGYDTSVRVWDARSRSARPIQVLEQATDAITSLLVGDAQIIAGSNDGRVRAYDLRGGQVCEDVIGEPVASMALTADNDALLVTTSDSKLRVFDRGNGKLLMSYQDANFVSQAYRIKSTLAAEDAVVLSGSESGSIVAWDFVTGALRQKVQHHGETDLVSSEGRRVVTAVACKSRGSEWASGAGDGSIVIWSTDAHLHSA